MTKTEFDDLKIDDILTNKVIGSTGYNYKVIDRTINRIWVEELSMHRKYTIHRNEIEKCLYLRKYED